MLIATFFAMWFIFLTPLIAKADSGYDYDNTKPTTCVTELPRWTSVSISGGTVSYSIKYWISQGATNGEDYFYYAHPKLWLENPKGGGEVVVGEGSMMRVYMNGGTGTTGTDSGSFSFNKSQVASMIDMKTYSPSIRSSGFDYSDYMCYASALGGSKRGTAELELCLYLADWYGPGDNTIFDGTGVTSDTWRKL